MQTAHVHACSAAARHILIWALCLLRPWRPQLKLTMLSPCIRPHFKLAMRSPCIKHPLRQSASVCANYAQPLPHTVHAMNLAKAGATPFLLQRPHCSHASLVQERSTTTCYSQHHFKQFIWKILGKARNMEISIAYSMYMKCMCMCVCEV